jgi:hypothetical protein
MPGLMLGSSAKEVAKMRFRGFNLTLTSLNPSSTSSQRIAAPPMTRAAGSIQTATVAVGASTSRLAAFGVKSAAPGAGPAAGSSSNPPAAATGTPMNFPPALFRAASNSKDDVDNQKSMHDMFSALFDGIVDAIGYGFNMYKLEARFADVQINAACATGGRLEGPALDGLIARAPSVAGWGGWEAMVRDAVAKGLEHQWSALARSVRVPGLPWYPAFVVFPGPQAPPIPNVPCPFIALSHDAMATSPENLKTAMRSALRGNMDYSMEFFESIAVALQAPLQMWKMSQQIMLVMGKGPIPTFAPPYVPVGPVIGGSIISAPGHLAS